MTQCPDCGAYYADDNDTCRTRFDVLLGLDHSRQEPWGSRHGLAFASFALQHPPMFAQSLDRSWSILYAIYVAGIQQDFVFRQVIAGDGKIPTEWNVPPRPHAPTALPSCTIADLHDFDASTYPEDIDRMCRAALAMWSDRSATERRVK